MFHFQAVPQNESVIDGLKKLKEKEMIWTLYCGSCRFFSL